MLETNASAQPSAAGMKPESPTDSMSADQRRAARAAAALGLLAISSAAGCWLTLRSHFDLLEILPAIVAVQVAGAVAVAAWLAFRRPPAR